MSTKPSLIVRIIVSAAAAGSIVTGIAVPVVASVAPATAVASTVTPDMIGHIG